MSIIVESVLQSQAPILASKKLLIQFLMKKSKEFFSWADSTSTSSSCIGGGVFCKFSCGIRLIFALIFQIAAVILDQIFRVSSILVIQAQVSAVSRSAFRSPQILPIPFIFSNKAVTLSLRLSTKVLILKAQENNFSLLLMDYCTRQNFSSKAAISILVILRVSLWKWLQMHQALRQIQGCLHPSSAQRQISRCMLCTGQQVFFRRKRSSRGFFLNYWYYILTQCPYFCEVPLRSSSIYSISICGVCFNRQLYRNLPYLIKAIQQL